MVIPSQHRRRGPAPLQEGSWLYDDIAGPDLSASLPSFLPPFFFLVRMNNTKMVVTVERKRGCTFK